MVAKVMSRRDGMSRRIADAVWLTNKEIAKLMAWEEETVSEIRRVYVDDAAVVVALGKRIADVL